MNRARGVKLSGDALHVHCRISSRVDIHRFSFSPSKLVEISAPRKA